jgi:hypothetical protein
VKPVRPRGHESIQTTVDTYSHLLPERPDRAGGGGESCGCGHALDDHAQNRTGACQVQVSDKFFCSCISAARDARADQGRP